MALGWMQAFPGRVAHLAAIDADAALEPVYAWNFPKTRFIQHYFDDNPEVDHAATLAESLDVSPESIDVLLAGPPCQSLSSAGKRQDHPDNRLALRVCDLTRELRPKIVVIENVPEFSYIHDGRLLGRVRLQLAKAGYATDTFTLNATSFGVPQVRMRSFVLGLRQDTRTSLPSIRIRPVPTHLAIASPRVVFSDVPLPAPDLDGVNLPLPPTVEEAIGDLPPLAAGDGHEESEYTMTPITRYQTQLRQSQEILFNHVAVNHSPDLSAAMDILVPGETPQRVPDHPLRRKPYFRSAYARLHPHSVGPTMTTQTQNPGSGRFTHYRDARTITVREVARFQSFPDSFRFFSYQALQRRHAGNAVPPLMSQAIACALAAYV